VLVAPKGGRITHIARKGDRRLLHSLDRRGHAAREPAMCAANARFWRKLHFPENRY